MEKAQLNLLLILVIGLYIFYALKRTSDLELRVIPQKGRIIFLTVVIGLLLYLSYVLKDYLLIVVSLMAALSFYLTIKGEGLTENGVIRYEKLRKYNIGLKFIDFSDLRDIGLKEGKDFLVFKADGSRDKSISIRMKFKKEDRDRILEILDKRNIDI